MKVLFLTTSYPTAASPVLWGRLAGAFALRGDALAARDPGPMAPRQVPPVAKLPVAQQAPAAMPRDKRLTAQLHPTNGSRRLTPVEKAIVAGGLLLLSAGVLGYARTRRC